MIFAEKEYKKRIIPKLPEKIQQIELVRLSSTSPAMAQLTTKEKLQQWSEILTYLSTN